MPQPLPEEISKVYINNLPKGFLNVDLEYPKELHDLHNDFPCAPEHIGEGNNRRLISGLNDKIGYWVHYRLRDLFKIRIIRLKRINDIIFFKEKSFIKKYIEKNNFTKNPLAK